MLRSNDILFFVDAVIGFFDLELVDPLLVVTVDDNIDDDDDESSFLELDDLNLCLVLLLEVVLIETVENGSIESVSLSVLDRMLLLSRYSVLIFIGALTIPLEDSDVISSIPSNVSLLIETSSLSFLESICFGFEFDSSSSSLDSFSL